MLIDNPDEMLGELETVEKQKLESTVEPMSDDIPDKYRGKELSDIIKMHQEAEKLIGKQAQEVGEVRKLADELIKQNLAGKPQPIKEEEPEVDFFENPQAAVRKTVENHPDVLAARQAGQEFKKMQIQQKLASEHPDFTQIVQDSANLAQIAQRANAAMAFSTNNTERMRIDSSGNVLVGTTSNFGKFTVSSACNTVKTGLVVANTDTGAGTFAGFLNSAGNTAGAITQTGTTTVNYGTSSDYRLKTEVQPIAGALAKVGALKPCTYTWKDDGSYGEGFIAHELAEVAPQCIVGEKDAVDAEGKPIYQTIDTSFLVATLTAAIQEQQALITGQQAMLASLTARIETLEQA